MKYNSYFHPPFRVKTLVSQLANLEDENETLARSLEAQKLKVSEIETDGRKKVDELAKELAKKARQ
jgi:homeobox protein cut-like